MKSNKELRLPFLSMPSAGWPYIKVTDRCACAQVRAGQPPARMRVLDLPFTAVEWIMPKDSANRAEPLKPPSSVNRQAIIFKKALIIAYESRFACQRVQHFDICKIRELLSSVLLSLNNNSNASFLWQNIWLDIGRP